MLATLYKIALNELVNYWLLARPFEESSLWVNGVRFWRVVIDSSWRASPVAGYSMLGTKQGRAQIFPRHLERPLANQLPYLRHLPMISYHS